MKKFQEALASTEFHLESYPTVAEIMMRINELNENPDSRTERLVSDHRSSGSVFFVFVGGTSGMLSALLKAAINLSLVKNAITKQYELEMLSRRRRTELICSAAAD